MLLAVWNVREKEGGRKSKSRRRAFNAHGLVTTVFRSTVSTSGSRAAMSFMQEKSNPYTLSQTIQTRSISTKKERKEGTYS